MSRPQGKNWLQVSSPPAEPPLSQLRLLNQLCLGHSQLVIDGEVHGTQTAGVGCNPGGLGSPRDDRRSCWEHIGLQALHQRTASVLQRRVCWQRLRHSPRCSGVFPSPSRWLGSAPWSRSSCTGNRKTQQELSEASMDCIPTPTPNLAK